ncbi:MAG: ABC transporter permease [Bacilli bacterium]|nr:ABC transporter permease [Bacilli bacterium]
MKNKLKYLISVSLKRKIKTKWFIAANILLLAVIAALINIDSVIKTFGGDFDENQIVYVIDNTKKTYDILKKENNEYNSLISTSEDSEFIIKKSNKNYTDILKKEKQAWVLIFNNSIDNVVDAKLISNNYTNTASYAKLISMLNKTKSTLALSEVAIDVNDFKKISSPIKVEREVLDKTKTSEDESARMIMSTVFPFIILPFFALTIFLVQMIGAEVNDEKTTRGMEIIISNVSPKIHLLSKIIASNLFVLLQGILLIIYSVIGVLIRFSLGSSGSFNLQNLDINAEITKILGTNIAGELYYIIPLALIMIILTFIAYSLLAGILASMTTNIEDFQQLQTPITVISLIGYYLAIMAGVFEGSLFIKIAAFIPLISAVLAPCLLLLGQFTLIEFGIATLLVIIVIFLLIKYGFRVYKEGILNYSSKNLWKKMFKAMKSK